MTFSLISAKGHLYSANACGGGSMRQRHKEENARLIMIKRDLDF